MGANSVGHTPNQRLNDQVSGLLDNARRQASQPQPPRMEELANFDGNPVDGQTPQYSQATGTWIPASSLRELPPFSMGGSITARTSGRWYPSLPLSIVKMTASFGTAATTDSVIALLRSGVTVVTLTMPATNIQASTTFNVAFATTDYIQTQLVTAGTGGRDLNVQYLYT